MNKKKKNVFIVSIDLTIFVLFLYLYKFEYFKYKRKQTFNITDIFTFKVCFFYKEPIELYGFALKIFKFFAPFIPSNQTRNNNFPNNIYGIKFYF